MNKCFIHETYLTSLLLMGTAAHFCWCVLQHCTGFARLVWGRLRGPRAFIYSWNIFDIPFGSVLQCAAMCCSVLQCAALCCSVSHMYWMSSWKIFDIPHSWMWHAYVVGYFIYEAHWHTVLVSVVFSIYVRIHEAYVTYHIHDCCDMPISNGVATISRLLKIIGFFCKKAL